MEIVNCDALEYIQSFPDSYFDLIILDPDYQDWEKLIKRNLIDECMRVLKKTGNVFCFTKQPFDQMLRNSVDPYFRREFVWTFENGGAWVSKKMPLVSFQKIYWLVKSKDFYFQPRTGLNYGHSTKAFKRATKVFGGYKEEGRLFEPSSEGTWIRDHFHFNKPKTGEIPSKPKEVIAQLIKCFSPDGGAVLDPFSGTGVIPVECIHLNRECYASEINLKRACSILDVLFGESNEINN